MKNVLPLPVPDFPLANEVSASRHHRDLRRPKFDPIDVGGNLFPVPVLIDDYGRSLEVDACDLGRWQGSGGGRL